MNWRFRLADFISGGALSEVCKDAWDVIRERNVYCEALHSIARNTCCDGCQEAALVANKALEEAE